MEKLPSILTRDHPVLREKARPVDAITKEIRTLITTMRKTMHRAQGVGLAANQIGDNRAIFIAWLEQEFYAFINPKIIKTGKVKEIREEGCLSVPGFWGHVERPTDIVVEGLNQRGKKVKVKAKGLLAQIFQHEIDHLNGVLYIDKALALHKLEKSET